jgi:hypothetical protein
MAGATPKLLQSICFLYPMYCSLIRNHGRHHTHIAPLNGAGPMPHRHLPLTKALQLHSLPCLKVLQAAEAWYSGMGKGLPKQC